MKSVVSQTAEPQPLTDMAESARAAYHNRAAPYWALAFVMTLLTGLATLAVDLGAFWRGYVLDMTGPAWNYILFRRLSHRYINNVWTRYFSPSRTFVAFLLVAFGIETAQYFELYAATFDPWDFLAYLSLLLPMYVIDLLLIKYAGQPNLSEGIHR